MSAEKQKTILLVEDEAIIAMTEKLSLEKYGYAVIIAHSGEDAVTIVEKTPAVDLILMDIDLGAGMDGTEAAAVILKDRDLPVVFLSSHMEPEVVEKTEKITSYGYVVKNSSLTVLDASIKMAFKLFEAKISKKKKEEELRESEEIMRYIVKHDPNAIAVYDHDLHYIAVSDRYLQDYNVREADIIGRHHYDVFPEIPQKWKDVHRRCLAGAIEHDDDDHFERPDGSITYTRWECRPWHRVDGEIGGIITYTEVTTERKLAEIKLAQSHDLLTKLARLVPGVIYQYRLDPDGRSAFPYASPGMNDIYEVTPEEVRDDATPVFARLHPDDYDRVAGAIQASALTLNTFHCEFRVLLPRQGLRWRWSQAHPERLADGGTLWHGIILDVTERKLADEALRESEEQFRTLGTMAPIGIYLTDTRGHCRYANPRWCEMAGLTLEEALGEGWTRGLHSDDREAVFAAWQKTVESAGRWGLEYRFRTGAGKVTWVQGLAVAQRDAQGVITGYVGANIDITERKLAEEALKAGEARAQALLSTVPDMLFRIDRRGVFLDYRAESGDLYDQSGASFIGKSCREIMPPEFADLIDAKIRSALESGTLQTFTYQLPIPGKGIRDFEARMIASGADEATVIVRDVTESHREHKALRGLEERWRDILFSMADWVWEVDEKGVYTYSSEKGEALLGYSREDIIGKTPFDFMPAEEARRVGAIFSGIVADKRVITDLENWNIGKNGKRICLLTNGVPILDEKGNIKGYRGVDKDITDRKRAEETLRESEERYRSILNASPDSIAITDMEGRIEMVSPTGLTMLGLQQEEVLGRSFIEFFYPGDRDRASAIVANMFQDPMTGLGEYRGLRAGGVIVELEVNGGFVQGADGRPAHMVFVIRDITDRKRAQDAQHAAETRYRLLFEQSPDGIVIINPATARILEFNSTAHQQLGYSREEFSRLSIADIDAVETPEETLSHIARVMHEGLSEFETRQRTKQGEIREIHVAAQFTKMLDRPLYHCIWRDITERKQAEEEIKKQLAEKETLLKEVHHRIKNNIASIAGLISLRLQSVANPEAIAVLKDAIGRVDSMRILYDKLLLGEDYKNVSVKNYVESLIDTVVALFPAHAIIKLDKHIADFHLDSKKLFPLGIIINELLTNTMKYAFPGAKKGQIKISLANVDNHVTFTVQDNGCGLPDGFDINKSTGFGLMLVKMLSQQLGGSFAIANHAGVRCMVEFDI